MPLSSKKEAVLEELFSNNGLKLHLNLSSLRKESLDLVINHEGSLFIVTLEENLDKIEKMDSNSLQEKAYKALTKTVEENLFDDGFLFGDSAKSDQENSRSFLSKLIEKSPNNQR